MGWIDGVELGMDGGAIGWTSYLYIYLTACHKRIWQGSRDFDTTYLKRKHLR